LWARVARQRRDEVMEPVDLEGERAAPAEIVRAWRSERAVDALDQGLLEDERLGSDLAEADAVLPGEGVLPVRLAGIGGDSEHPGGELGPPGEVVRQRVDVARGADQIEEVGRKHPRAVPQHASAARNT